MREVWSSFKNETCFDCGDKLGRLKANVVDAQGAVQGIADRPPSDVDCARKVVMGHKGALAVWISRDNPTPVMLGKVGAFQLGPAAAIEWYVDGRRALRDEVIGAIKANLPESLEVASRGEMPGFEYTLLGERVRALVPTLPRKSSPNVGHCVDCRLRLDDVGIIGCTREDCPGFLL